MNVENMDNQDIDSLNAKHKDDIISSDDKIDCSADSNEAISITGEDNAENTLAGE